MIKRCLGTLILTAGLGLAQTSNILMPPVPMPVCSITQTAACLLMPQDYQSLGQKLGPTSLIPWPQIISAPAFAKLGPDGLVLPAELPAGGTTSATANSLVAALGSTLAITGTPGPVPLGGCGLSSADGMWNCLDGAGNAGTMIKTGTPASSADICTPPQAMQDGVNIYICVAINQWKKVALVSY